MLIEVLLKAQRVLRMFRPKNGLKYLQHRDKKIEGYPFYREIKANNPITRQRANSTKLAELVVEVEVGEEVVEVELVEFEVVKEVDPEVEEEELAVEVEGEEEEVEIGEEG